MKSKFIKLLNENNNNYFLKLEDNILKNDQSSYAYKIKRISDYYAKINENYILNLFDEFFKKGREKNLF